MIRTALIVALVPFAACAPKPPVEPIATTQDMCVADAAQGLVGRPLTDAVAQEVKAKAKARIVRILRPDTIVTMEYNPGRVDISVDARDTIVRIGCG